ncbi:ankyrin repeat and zinc finger domain-containing protein 1-like isoform X2 [Coccinella septempunctata]|uniref:ankyrin repeat and zinc finger domain-containing protein 1-like isoform X2 n=1 Tax=Coccinella septempunctata TaxID=41139 RepID=UPI001D060101|nr:ankyrin repeat and zinc finger domain-containing protein 1-like isoform X2 [Coccinella septempunctata]
METTNVFEEKFKEILSSELKNVLLENSEEEQLENPFEKLWESQTTHNMSCSYCQMDFPDVGAQREHFKLDWHRFNLKQHLSGKNAISEHEFNERNGNDDISSISGSESEKEDSLDTFATAQGKMFLQNKNGQIFSIYKCLIFNKKDDVNENIALSKLRSCCIQNQQWTVLMLGGGHFAGAVFKGSKPIVHKTFHCYTVRQGQGGSQSSKDNKSGGSHPKSAGASLRRYNEQALIQHIQDIVEQWKTEIGESSVIFYRAPGPYNRSVLFGGPKPILDRSDNRLRTIPFSTRRATFAEVQRVHQLLITTNLYGNLDMAVKQLDKHRLLNRESKRNRIRGSHINRAKSREKTERPLPTKHSSETNSLADSIPDDDEEDIEELPLNTEDIEISFEHLEVFVDSEKSAFKPGKKRKPKKSKVKILQEKEDERKSELINILCTGNLIRLKELLENVGNGIDNELNIVNDLKNEFLNEVLDEDGNSLMHIAAMNEHVDLVRFLLENNSDPCLKNKKHQTPYSSSSSTEVREAMKDFAKENPEKYNYNKAQIPLNSLTREEMAEKKKQQRKIKREKEKLKKEENKIKKMEETEKECFLKLSDREKRALAAERRILGQNGKVISRCFVCAADMAGKVPFEYMNNRFCSMDCLKSHRLKNSLI